MITISKKVEYGLMFLTYLTKNKGVVSLNESAKELNLPYRFWAQIVGILKTGEILDSKEGKGGGYSFLSGWDKKNLYDLMVALGEDRRIVKCLGNEGSCLRMDRCQMRKVWGKIEEGLIDKLKEIKLTEIL
jgi:Rrf2 family protein